MQDTISRKDFLKNAFRIFRLPTDVSAETARIEDNTYLYPPGIASVDNFLSSCQQNYDCISQCPHEALAVFRENENDKRYGFPVIKPRQAACYFCDDFPCIDACTSEALKSENKSRKLGTAKINSDHCLAYQNTFCQACVVNCPLTGSAIFMNTNSQPVVSDQNCTGCGLCVQCCPVGPSAILIETNIS